jgi:outer membrane immunogenic protein
MQVRIDAKGLVMTFGMLTVALFQPPLARASDTASGQWAGPYVGLTVGGKWADATWTTTQLVDPPSAFVGQGTLDGSSPDTFKPSAARAGAIAGYNWRSDRWVYGAELDLAWADRSDTHAGIPGCKIGCFAGAPGPGNDRSSVRVTWDASLRGRVGYLATPSLLLYGTGGIAWQRLEVSGTCENTLADPVCLVSPPFAAKTQTDRSTRAGWTLGAGVEHLLTDRWLVRAEYRYARFDAMRGVLFAGQPSADPGADAIHYDVALHTHVASVGLVYKF